MNDVAKYGPRMKRLNNLIVFVSPNGQLPQQRQLTSKIFLTLAARDFRAKVDPIALPFMALTHVDGR